ncbi:MAG: zf-HC2 domain-containing protein [Actinomycetota bacterium]
MDCFTARETLSASLDGEAAPAERTTLDNHLEACAGCRAFAAEVLALHRLVRVAPAAAVPDLSAQIVAAAILPSESPPPLDRSLRLGLVAVGVVLVLAGLPGLLETGGAAHARHLSSFDVALAVGFLWVAARPARALSGFLPIGSVLVVTCVTLALLDAAEGDSETLRTITHSIAVLGMGAAWLLEARAYRPVTLAA